MSMLLPSCGVKYVLDAGIETKIDTSHLKCALSNENSNILGVHRVLHYMLINRPPADCIAICMNVLNNLQSLRASLFLTNFLLRNLRDHLTDDFCEEVEALWYGTRLLLNLPNNILQEYIHLRYHPKLIIEQLFMNMKVGVIEKCKCLLMDNIHTIDERNKRCCSQSNIDEMVIYFAKKAVHLPEIYLRPLNSESDIAMKSSDEPDQCLEPTFSHKKVKRNIASLPESRSLPKLSMLGESPKFMPPPNFMSPPRLTGKIKDLSVSGIPKKSDWVPDTRVSICMVCNLVQFTFITRRHHCRRCGRVVCEACSKHFLIVPGYGDNPVRCCNECFESELRQHHMPTSQNKPVEAISTSMMEQDDTVIVTNEMLWKLYTSEAMNRTVRDEFHYPQTPSVPLCMSLIKLHSNSTEMGLYMLKLCNNLADVFKPLSEGKINIEMDYGLILSMMKSLLQNSKVKLLEGGNSDLIELCDNYLSHVDIINLLLTANIHSMPSFEQLNKPQTLQILRDAMIQKERWELAKDICTKSGIDVSPVWMAWGLAKLQNQEYSDAREMLNKVLKPVSDKNQISKQRKQEVLSQKQLQDVILCLKSSRGMGPSQQTTSGNKLSDLNIKQLLGEMDVSAEGNTQFKDSEVLSQEKITECVFYLKTYGTHHSVLQFYTENGYMQKALEYVLKFKCYKEAFISGIFKPALEFRKLDELKHQMLLIDASLAKWQMYIDWICEYLSGKSYFNLLRAIHLFRGDFLSAGETCIKLYMCNSSCYTHLSSRVHYLNMAKKNILEAIRLKQEDGKDTSQLHSLLVRIQLQTQVSTIISGMPLSKVRDMANDTELPTLFGSDDDKVAVSSCLLLQAAHSPEITNSVVEIVTNLKLNPSAILEKCVLYLVKLEKYTDARQLLLKATNLSIFSLIDVEHVIQQCIKALVNMKQENLAAETFIKLLSDDDSKIAAYMMCGNRWLTDAYLLAVSTSRIATDSRRISDVHKIRKLATDSKQENIRQICDKYLSRKL